jgi:hypothetical protein
VNVLFKFENGAEIETPMCDGPVPVVCSMTTPEGARFYFFFVDELPSGRILFRETTKEQAQKVWRELE